MVVVVVVEEACLFIKDVNVKEDDLRKMFQGIALTEQMSTKGTSMRLMEIEFVDFIPVDCNFGAGWQLETVQGTIYKNVNLSARDFEAYDDTGAFSFSKLQPSRTGFNKDIDSIMMKCEKCDHIQDRNINIVYEKSWCDMRMTPSPKIKCRKSDAEGIIIISNHANEALTEQMSTKGISMRLMEIESVDFTPVDCNFGAGWQLETVQGTI
ncbi:hypothetical protein POM88_033677 [Heracleum sosnowskyi]|uniref:Uncharacterized protein n=1 Tax=Heracleum sosnowskyi TaxID=360622 RepID=A0AAD8HK79_9APIA|nr:hypothetical protein POM88_033677 [Heracleum sosnowskyi]